MPRRKPAYRRVTPLASRRETQRRAALALLALVVVVGGLGLAVYAFGGTGKTGAIASVNQGQAALDKAAREPRQGQGPRRSTSSRTDPGQAEDAPDRGVPAARRGRAGERQRRGRRPAPGAGGRRPRRALRRRPGGLHRRCSRSSPRPARRRSTSAGWCRAPTAPRTCSTARRRPSTASTSRTRRRRSWPAPAPKAGGTTVATPQVPRRRWPGRADPRLEERPVALALVQSRRARAPWSGSRSRAAARGATT